jgi:threonine dehydrogenase-like Zn-dependent dehydrogenase
MLLKIVRSGKLQPSKFATYRLALSDIMKAYDRLETRQKGALQVVLRNGGRR